MTYKIGITLHLNDKQHIDGFMAVLKRNVGAVKNDISLDIDMDNAPEEVISHFQNSLKINKDFFSSRNIPVNVTYHQQNRGRAEALNGIFSRTLSDNNCSGVIQICDNLILENGAIDNLIEAVSKKGLVGGDVKVLDFRADTKNPPTLAQWANIFYEHQAEKGPRQGLHGKIYGLSKDYIKGLMADGGIPNIHFDDSYLSGRHWLNNYVPPYICDKAKGFFIPPGTAEQFVKKLSRYAEGNRQLISLAGEKGAAFIQSYIEKALSSRYEKAFVDVIESYKLAEQHIKITDIPPGKNPEIDNIENLYSKLTENVPLRPDMPSIKDITNLLRRALPLDKKENYTLSANDEKYIMPLVNNVCSLLGNIMSKNHSLVNGSSWSKDDSVNFSYLASVNLNKKSKLPPATLSISSKVSLVANYRGAS